MLAVPVLALALLAGSPAKVRNVPTVAKEPRLDGNLKDLPATLALTPVDGADVSAHFAARIAFRKDTLYIGIELTDDALIPADVLTVSLHFPGAGTTASGYEYRFALDGLRAHDGAPELARQHVRAGVTKGEKGLTLEAAFPARSLPRFPAHEPLLLELCATYEDRDEPAAEAKRLSTCQGGSLAGGPVRVPDELRKTLKLTPPEGVAGIESRPGGWVGYATLHYPMWVQGDEALNAAALQKLVADEPVDPKASRIHIPARMAVPDGRELVAVLSGKDPFAIEGQCRMQDELRLALYAVKGKIAERVLEWPAATCALGRAASIELDDEGGLSIGYSNGSVATFIWASDHFERTELGSRQ